MLPISKINARRRILVPSSNDSIAFVETDILIGTETIGAVLSQCLRWRLPAADVMPNAHETAVQMIDMSIVHVFRRDACIARNKRRGQWAGGAGLISNIHAVVDTDTHQPDLGPKSTRAGGDGTQARARLSRSKPS